MSVLGIPVDYKLWDSIRKLINEESTALAGPESSHIEKLRTLSTTISPGGLPISNEEVNFACYLAEPAVQGGIVIVLKQPWKNQEYNKTTEEVVNECPTLAAIRDLADFFNIPLSGLSIFDAFPFITELKLDPKDAYHAESHDTFYQMMVAKRPAVVLTAWESSPFESHTTRPWQKLRTGEVFDTPYSKHGSDWTFSMVNMPHPSYYMNRYPTESCFRQLQILEFAQACGRFWDIWEEKEWMKSLRNRCKARAKVLYESGDDPSDDTVIIERVVETLKRLKPVLKGMRYGFSSKAQIEQDLSQSNVLELCSDASLILRQVATIESNDAECDIANIASKASMDFFESWYGTRWSPMRKSVVMNTTNCPGLYHSSCFDYLSQARNWPPLARQIESCMVAFCRKLNLSWTPCDDEAFHPNFESQATAFFDLTRGIEDAMDGISDNVQDDLDKLETDFKALNTEK